MQRTAIHPQTVQDFLSRPEVWAGPYEILFADPPYDATLELTNLLIDVDRRLVAPGACVIVEHGKNTILPAELAGRMFVRRYDYGDTALSLFSIARTGRS
jgi:16S rRNA G966 N2-methylase RsmD